MNSDKEYFDHIVKEIYFISENTGLLSKEALITDPILKIAGSRDKIIHGYFAIDYDIIWDIITNKIPYLKIQIETLLKNENFLL